MCGCETCSITGDGVLDTNLQSLSIELKQLGDCALTVSAKRSGIKILKIMNKSLDISFKRMIII